MRKMNIFDLDNRGNEVRKNKKATNATKTMKSESDEDFYGI